MKFAATKDELAKLKLVDSGWYPVELFNTTNGKAKKDGAGYQMVEARIIGEKEKGNVLAAIFSEKFQAGIAPFYEVLTGKVWDGQEFELKLSDIRGKKQEWFVRRGEDANGRPQNQVVEFRPLQSV